jgi:predicted dehydrogenase
MIRIGIAGIGFMGMIHYLAARQLRGARVAAICSRDRRKLDGDWRSIRGNFGPPGEQMDLSEIRRSGSFEALLADPEIDLVDICTPTVHHADMAIRALKAGKHVLVEKPIALEIQDGERMVEAARNAGKLLMVGQVLPFFGEFALLAEAVRSNRYGRLLAGQFQRIIARPDWSDAIGDVAQNGGPAIDLHIHDAHFIRMVCGRPKAVYARGRVEGDSVVHLNTQYSFGEEGPIVSCSCGALSQSGRPFMHGYEAYFEEATLVYQSQGIGPVVYSRDGRTEKANAPNREPVECFAAELQAATDAVEGGGAPPELQDQMALDALRICRLEIESVRRGEIVALPAEKAAS